VVPDGGIYAMSNTADKLPVVAIARALAIDLRPHRSDPRIVAPRVGGGAEQDETSDHGEPEHHDAAHENLLFVFVSSLQFRNAPLGD
jgi:hypothetical protein